MWVYLTLHVFQLKPISSSPLCPPSNPLPPSQTVNDQPAYTVWQLLDVHHWSYQYLVDWEVYGPEEHSWVPCAYIMVPSLIRDDPGKPGGSPGGSHWVGDCRDPSHSSYVLLCAFPLLPFPLMSVVLCNGIVRMGSLLISWTSWWQHTWSSFPYSIKTLAFLLHITSSFSPSGALHATEIHFHLLPADPTVSCQSSFIACFSALPCQTACQPLHWFSD